MNLALCLLEKYLKNSSLDFGLPALPMTAALPITKEQVEGTHKLYDKAARKLDKLSLAMLSTKEE